MLDPHATAAVRQAKGKGKQPNQVVSGCAHPAGLCTVSRPAQAASALRHAATVSCTFLLASAPRSSLRFSFLVAKHF